LISYSELEPSYDPLFSRPNTLAWLPRWFQGYYSNDTLRKLYYIALVAQKEKLEVNSKGIVPGFYNPVLEPRLALTASYSNLADKELAMIVQHASGVEIGIRHAKSYGDFLSEKKNPISFKLQGQLLFRNLNNHTYSQTSNEGYVSLAPALASGFTSDSIIIVENPSGDQKYFPRFSS